MSATINILILKWKTSTNISLCHRWPALLLFAAESILTNRVLCNVIEVSNIITLVKTVVNFALYIFILSEVNLSVSTQSMWDSCFLLWNLSVCNFVRIPTGQMTQGGRWISWYVNLSRIKFYINNSEPPKNDQKEMKDNWIDLNQQWKISKT